MRREFVALGGTLDNRGIRPPIGGSCYAVRVNDDWLLIDSGVYPQSGEKFKEAADCIIKIEFEEIGGEKLPILPKCRLLDDRDFIPAHFNGLPMYDLLKDARRIYNVVTHSHTDHNGSTPMLKQVFPNAQMLMTKATFDISKWGWKDGLKLRRRYKQPLIYNNEDIDRLTMQVVESGQVKEYERKQVGPFDLTFFPSGHILGGVSVLVRIQDPTPISLFFTSDICFQDQRTLRGAPLLSGQILDGVDYLVTEATYAGRDEAPVDRKGTEKALVEEIKQALKRGGKVLLPVLSIGRSAEIMSILKQYGILNDYPVWVDGSAHDLVKIYARHGALPADAVGRNVPGRAGSTRERQSIINDPNPCVIVASAGMVTGGWSPFYAKKLAGDKKNLIALSCYQAKDSPGYKLLRVKKGQKVEFGEGKRRVKVEVNARVKQFHLSSHAQGRDLLEMVRRIDPRKGVFAVHGERRGIRSFKNKLGGKYNITPTILGRKYKV